MSGTRKSQRSHRLPAHLASYGLRMLTASRDQQIIIKQRAQWSSESATAAADQVCQNVTEGSEAAEALCAEPLSSESVTAAADRPASRYGQQIRPNLRLKRLEVDPKPT